MNDRTFLVFTLVAMGAGVLKMSGWFPSMVWLALATAILSAVAKVRLWPETAEMAI